MAVWECDVAGTGGTPGTQYFEIRGPAEVSRDWVQICSWWFVMYCYSGGAARDLYSGLIGSSPIHKFFLNWKTRPPDSYISFMFPLNAPLKLKIYASARERGAWVRYLIFDQSDKSVGIDENGFLTLRLPQNARLPKIITLPGPPHDTPAQACRHPAQLGDQGKGTGGFIPRPGPRSSARRR